MQFNHPYSLALHHGAGKKDMLKQFAADDEVLIAADESRDGAKAFRTCPLRDWLKQTAEHDLHEYEVLRGAVSPFLDLEWTDTCIAASDVFHWQVNERASGARDGFLHVRIVCFVCHICTLIIEFALQ